MMRAVVLFGLVGCSAAAPQTAVTQPPSGAVLVSTQAAAEPSAVESPAAPPPAPVVSPEQAAQDECVKTSKVSACLPMFGVEVHDSVSMSRGAACSSACLADRGDERLAPVVDAARAACMTAYAKNKKARCVFAKAKGPTDAREQSARFQDALGEAVAHRDDPAKRDALDATMPMLDADRLKELEPECTRTCRERASAP